MTTQKKKTKTNKKDPKSQTVKVSIYNQGWFNNEKFTIKKFNKIIKRVKSEYDHFDWKCFYIQPELFGGFDIVGERSLTDEEDAKERRRQLFENLKEEFEEEKNDRT